MTVTLEHGVIRLRGSVPVEAVEALLPLLQGPAPAMVALDEADHLHAAIVQLLLAFRPIVTGTPRDPFLRRWLAPLLVRNSPD